MLIAHWSNGNIGWGWQFVLLFISLISYGSCAVFVETALKAAAEQDRRYMLESIRSAHKIRELDDAGLFGHIFKIEHRPGIDQKTVSVSAEKRLST